MTLPSLSAGLEGRLPETRDFADAAALILGMHGMGKAAGAAVRPALAGKLKAIHRRTGLTPDKVARDVARDPELADALLNGKKTPEPFTPEGAAEPLYQAGLKELYSGNGSVKMIFRDTGVEPSLTDGGRLRSYLESLNPQEVRRLKRDSPQEYLAVLKSIVRRFFPRGGGLRFRRGQDGRALDYEHFAGRDSGRDAYLGTLPATLKKQDVRVEFTTAEGEAKACLIRKYFNADVQKDVWDMLVIRDGELKTKIARSEKRGQNYIETQIIRAGDTVPQPATAGGATESTSTPRGEHISTIRRNGGEDKVPDSSTAKTEAPVPRDFTDYRTDAEMETLQRRLLAIKPKEEDIVYTLKPEVAASPTKAARLAQNLEKDLGVTAVPVELSPGTWALRVQKVPEPPLTGERLKAGLAEMYAAMKNGEQKTLDLGIVEPKEAARIKARTHLDTLLCKRGLNTRDIQHAFDRHGKEQTRGQASITEQDFVRYGEVLSHPQDIQPGTNPNSIVFVRRFPDGTLYVTEQLLHGKKLLFRTLWRQLVGGSLVPILTAGAGDEGDEAEAKE